MCNAANVQSRCNFAHKDQKRLLVEIFIKKKSRNKFKAHLNIDMSEETHNTTQLPPQEGGKKVLSAEKQKKKDAKEAKKLKAKLKLEQRNQQQPTDKAKSKVRYTPSVTLKCLNNPFY